MTQAQSTIIVLREILEIIDRKSGACPSAFWVGVREQHLDRMARFAREVFVSANGQL